MPSLQSFSEDALDFVAQDLQSLSVEQMASIAAAEQQDFEAGPAPDSEVLDAHSVQQEYAEPDEDDDGPRARKRSAQTYASFDDGFDVETGTLAISSRDDQHTRAFKVCFDALLRGSRSRSWTGCYAVLIRENGQNTSRPSPADFAADVMLAAKRSLSPLLYRVLCACVDAEFSNYHRLPEPIRRKLTTRVGRKLLSRGICNDKSKITYWKTGPTLHQLRRFSGRIQNA